MRDKLNITIRIADQPPIPLSINWDEEETIRAAEYNVNRLWSLWRDKFNKPSSEVLAMVTFQFAKAFLLQNKHSEEALATLKAFEADLDKILLDTESE